MTPVVVALVVAALSQLLVIFLLLADRLLLVKMVRALTQEVGDLQDDVKRLRSELREVHQLFAKVANLDSEGA